MNSREIVFTKRAAELGAEVTVRQTTINVRVGFLTNTFSRGTLFDMRPEEAHGAAEAVVSNLVAALTRDAEEPEVIFDSTEKPN